jgi:flagellar biosynthetic protein FliQ
VNAQQVLTIGQQALYVMVLLSAPLLITALVVGLVVSVLQAATQINEMTLSFLPKLLAMFLVLVAAGPWMLALIVDYLQRVLTSIGTVVS